MPGTTAGIEQGTHACHCLNIRIRSGNNNEVDTPPPPSTDEPAFSQVFVGEQGISVSHPQLTVRTRTRGVPVAGTSRFSRYTTITCLLCHFAVYRVYQTYSPGIEGKDGPLLPTEDWVERDILKSLTGWIEIHKDCLTGNAVEEAALSANFSALFNLVLLPPESPATTPEPIYERPPSRSLTVSPPPPPPKFFANLQPVFLPPPFTPSHPVFSYLADYAIQESQALRDAAEEHMTEQMKLKTSEIESADMELRRKVNTLWKRVREGVSQIQQVSGHPGVRRASTSGSRERAAINGREPTSSGMPSVSVIRNFIPTSALRQRSSSPPAPRVSALSASLTNSSFHHPRARATATSPPPSDDRASSHLSNGTSYSGSTAASSTIAIPHSVDNVHHMRRNISDGLDMATSYKYFVVLEEDLARKRGRPLTKPEDAPDQSQVAGSSRDPIVKDDDIQKQQEKQFDSSDEPVSPSREADKKGKRKVTFDVKPAVVTIKREVTSEQAEEEENAAKRDTDMIFALEDLEGAHQGSPGKATLQLVEQPTIPVRARRRQRPQNMDNLSTSFSGLRPASLPIPSLIRPSRNGPELSNPTLTLSLPRSSLPSPAEAPASSGGDVCNSHVESNDGFRTPPPDPKMLELLAANTPSHRGAWKPESKAWQTFVKRQPGRQDSEAILEEGEDDVGTDASGFAIPDVLPKHMQQPVIAGSLPVSMKLPKPREELSLASYQPTTLAKQAHMTSPTTHKKQSTAAIRKAVYAERDRSRTLDPGPLDFASVNDEEEEDDDDDVGDELAPAPADASSGERGRRAAFKILKARSEIPDSGMWRSLA